MSEDQELLDRIGKLAGHINLHRNHTVPSQHGTNSGLAPPPPWNKFAQDSYSSKNDASWRSPRVASYSRGNSRAGRVVANPHRNRTLVLNNKAGLPNPGSNDISPGAGRPRTSVINTEEDEESEPLQTANVWVTKRDRHMQLINSSIYDKDSQARNKAIEETRRQKLLRKDQREKQKIERRLGTLTTHPSQKVAGSAVHEISINGLRFHVADSGSKLVRIRGANDSASTTPKQTSIGGVSFLRSKNGNLYRSGIVKARRAMGKIKKIPELCKRFTSTGHCPKGPMCLYIHDPAKVAMCKDFLQTGECVAGDSCDLSHEPMPERVPACLHFLRGKCSHPSCRYAHVRVNPSAPVCKDFAVLGYCSKGADCSERHVHECPDYANTGACRKQKCHLPHVDRAGQIRKHAANIPDPLNGSGQDDDDSDIVSDAEYEEIDSDDLDSDGLEEDLRQLADGTPPHALSQQQDFVHF